MFHKFQDKEILKASTLNGLTEQLWVLNAGRDRGRAAGFFAPNDSHNVGGCNRFQLDGSRLRIRDLHLINESGYYFQIADREVDLKLPEKESRVAVIARVDPWQQTTISWEAGSDAEREIQPQESLLAWVDLEHREVRLRPPFLSLRAVGALWEAAQDVLRALVRFRAELVEYVAEDPEGVDASALLAALESCEFLLANGNADTLALRHSFAMLARRLRGYFARMYAVRQPGDLSSLADRLEGAIAQEYVLLPEDGKARDRGMAEFIAQLPLVSPSPTEDEQQTYAALVGARKWTELFHDVIPRLWIRSGQVGAPEFLQAPRTGWRRYAITIKDTAADRLQLRVSKPLPSLPQYRLAGDPNSVMKVIQLARNEAGNTWEASMDLPGTGVRRLEIDLPASVDPGDAGCFHWNTLRRRV